MARPAGVMPIISVKFSFQQKWSLHLFRRGWNNRTGSPLVGSVAWTLFVFVIVAALAGQCQIVWGCRSAPAARHNVFHGERLRCESLLAATVSAAPAGTVDDLRLRRRGRITHRTLPGFPIAASERSTSSRGDRLAPTGTRSVVPASALSSRSGAIVLHTRAWKESRLGAWR